MKPATIVFVSANAVLLAMALFALATFGSVRLGAGYYLRGERILVDSAQKSFGAAAPGETVHVSFKLTNTNDREVRILGCQAGCNCAVPSDLPFVLGPNESKDFTVSVHLPQPQRGAGETRLDLPITLFTNSAPQPRVRLAVQGQVADEAAKAIPTP